MSIVLKNITKKYNQQIVLSDINLTFDENGLVFIIGNNGSGKTSLLNILGLIDNSFDGEILFERSSIKKQDRNLMSQIRASHINFIFQESNLIDDLSVSKNIEVYKKIKKVENDNSIFKSELDKLNKKLPKVLSGGERQKVAIYRGLLNGDVILCDEPVASLDYNSAIEVMDQLKKVSKDKLVIVVMHSMELVSKYADRIIEIKDGSIHKDITINKNKQLKIENKINEVKYRTSILDFVFSFFSRRKLKSIMYMFLLTFFSILLSIMISLFSFDQVAAISNRLEAGTKLQVSKSVEIDDPFIGNHYNYVVSNGYYLESILSNAFDSSNYNYMVNSIYGNVYFTDRIDVVSNEALVDINVFFSLTGKTVFEEGHTLTIDNNNIGIHNLELEIVGITEEKGIYASKALLNRNTLSSNKIAFAGGMFKNNIFFSLDQYYYERPLYIKLSYYKEILLDAGYDESFVNDMNLSNDEIAISNGYFNQYIDSQDDEVHVEFRLIPSEIDPYYQNQFIDLTLNIFQNGADVKFVLPSSISSSIDNLGEYFVVNDNVYNQIISQVPLHTGLYLSINNQNKTEIAKLFLNNEFRFSNLELNYIANIPNMIKDLETALIIITITSIVSILIILSLLTSTILLTKRNEVGLLQSFGFTKIKSLLPTLYVVLTVIIISLISTFILIPSTFEGINSIVFNMNGMDVPLLIMNAYVVTFIVIVMILLVALTFVINYRKIKVLNPKDIFKFN